MKDFNLKISEIKKANRYASKKNGVPCEITGYTWESDPMCPGWVDVRCEVCTVERPDKPFERMPDILICCRMSDRRRSFVQDAY